MLELSAGRKLCEARLARRMTIEEAAHAVRMRPDKIQALENDEYTRFGGTAYAKGFLLIYSRFLEVDVSSQLRAMEPSDHRVHVEDYQYLNSAPAPEPIASTKVRRDPFRREQQPPSVIPLLVFLAVFILAGGGMYFYTQSRRLELNKHVPAPASPAAPGVPTPAENPAPTATEPSTAGGPRRLAEQPPVARPVASEVTAVPVIPPTAINELIVEPLKKTWVTIRKDSADTPPIFEDYVYPGIRPLKLKGARFFVEVRDQSAVQIRKNGAPIAYQAPGISIQ